MNSPGEQATKEAIRNHQPMTVLEYAKAQRTWRATKKRIERDRAPRLANRRGFHRVHPEAVYLGRTWSQGSFGDIDYGD